MATNEGERERATSHLLARTPAGAQADRALLLDDEELQALVREYEEKVSALQKLNAEAEETLVSKERDLSALQETWKQLDPDQAARIHLKDFVDLVAELENVRDDETRLAEKENAFSQTHETQRKLAETDESLHKLREVVNANDAKIAHLREVHRRTKEDEALAKAEARERRERARQERLDDEKRRLRSNIAALQLELSRSRDNEKGEMEKEMSSRHRRGRHRPRRPLHGRLDDDENDDDGEKSEDPQAKAYDALLAPFAGINLLD